MAFNKFKKNIRQRRLWTWLRVNFKFASRKVRRFFIGEYFRKAVRGQFARKVYIALISGIFAILSLTGAHITNVYLRDTEDMIVNKLTYGADYDTAVPYFRTLNAIGCSNHLCVTVKTGKTDNLSDRTATLDAGGVNLRLTFTDGTAAELSLKKKFRKDSFISGKETHFIVTLPFGYTPFDIGDVALTITAAADGSYDDWLCEYARVSLLLGGKRQLIAESTAPARLGSGTDLVRSIELKDVRSDSQTYSQTSLLFQKLNTLSQHGLTDFDDITLKNDTLQSLALSSATALYMDVETVSATRNGQIHTQPGENSRLPETEDLNYNGVLRAEVTFHTRLKDGAYTYTYLLDTPGKDDFEMSCASTFRMDMPEGKCVFDIASVTLYTEDTTDAWAPRFARLYLTLDYGLELELARLTDRYLEQQYDTCIFYKGFLDNGVTFDLSATNAIPAIEVDTVKENFNVTLSDTAYSMYFEPQSFYSRQLRFFAQADKIYYVEDTE
ncbi:MAG: hypothetical protein IKY33_02920 [Clostridia bacterium]|nr:hypothetical protein [Clostridia bacterium]